MFKMDLILENSMAQIHLNSYLLRGKWSTVAVPEKKGSCTKVTDGYIRVIDDGYIPVIDRCLEQRRI